MKKEKIYGIVSIILAIIAIILSYNKDIFLLTLIISIAAGVFYYLSAYTKQIEKNEESINNIEKKLEINEKLLNTLNDILVVKELEKIRGKK